MNKYEIKPVGFVKNNVKEARFGGFKNEVSEIILDEEFTSALTGIEDYSHVIVVYIMDKVKDYVIEHRPQGNPEVPIVGIFACRCPQRPNNLAITTVEVLGRDKNILKVKGLDILDGTPIFDIKPYWPQYDMPKKPKYPAWVDKLDL